MIKLYELAGAEENRRFSPYCWRIRMSLAHKGLAVDCLPWRFTEKEKIKFSGQERVPVLVDGDHTVSDSWQIAKYLEAEYPDATRSKQSRAHANCSTTCASQGPYAGTRR